MKSRLQLARASLHGLILTTLGTTDLRAAPMVDKVYATTLSSNVFGPYIYGDDVDPNVFYIPYSKIAIASTPSSPNVPDFSFTYLPDGLIIQVGLKASIDKEGVKPLVDEIKKTHPNAKFRTLPVEWGRYVPTLASSSALSVNASARDESVIAHNQPQQVKNMIFLLSPSEGDLVVQSLLNGGVFAVNYEYMFKAAITPSKLKISMDWNEIEDQIITEAQSHNLSAPSLKDLIQSLQADSAIRIEIQGNVGGAEAGLSFVQKTISDRCFQTVATSASGGATAYKRNAGGCSKGDETYEFVSGQTLDVTAAAGFQFWRLCESYPQNFSFKGADGTMKHGCPKGTYGLSGTIKETDAGASPLPISDLYPAPILEFNP